MHQSIVWARKTTVLFFTFKYICLHQDSCKNYTTSSLYLTVMRPHLHNVNLHIAVIYTYTIFIAAEYFPTEQRKSDNKNLLHVKLWNMVKQSQCCQT